VGAMHGRVLFASQAWSDHDGEVFAALGDGTLLGSNDEGERWVRVPVELGGASAVLLALE